MPIAVCRKVLNQASLLAPFEIPTLQSTSKAAGDERAVCRSLSENPREELQLLAQAVWIQVPGIRGMQFRSKRRLLGATARQPTRKRIWQKFMQFVQVSLSIMEGPTAWIDVFPNRGPRLVHGFGLEI